MISLCNRQDQLLQGSNEDHNEYGTFQIKSHPHPLDKCIQRRELKIKTKSLRAKVKYEKLTHNCKQHYESSQCRFDGQ